MTARDRLGVMIRTSHGDMTVWSAPEVDEMLDAYRAEILAEAIKAAQCEVTTDGTGQPEDVAYDWGVMDAAAAIGALLEGGESRG
ncbi:hypothetical protein ADK55_18450 [Streptomyces sp. WM4235]|nr:hypothetical protein ADK55_18450 [Streptomyces sp. WM4235]